MATKKTPAPAKELVAIYPVGQVPGPPYRVSAEDAATYVATGEYSYDDATLASRGVFETASAARADSKKKDEE